MLKKSWMCKIHSYEIIILTQENAKENGEKNESWIIILGVNSYVTHSKFSIVANWERDYIFSIDLNGVLEVHRLKILFLYFFFLFWFHENWIEFF